MIVKQNHLNTMILTKEDYKNSHVIIIEIYQKKKKRKIENMQEIDIRTSLMRKKILSEKIVIK